MTFQKSDFGRSSRKIVRTGSGMRWIVAGNNQGRGFNAQHLFRLGAGRRIAVE